MKNTEEVKPVNVVIEGKYRKNTFQPDYFEGRIEIDAYEVTKGSLRKVIFSTEEGYAPLDYMSGSDLIFWGYIKMDKRAKNFIICVYEGELTGAKSFNSEEGTVIVYPERSFNEIKNQLVIPIFN